jgi:hypothetical protein
LGHIWLHNSEQKQLKMAWSKNIVYPISVTQKCVRIVSCPRFWFKKMLFYAICKSNGNNFHLFVAVFVYITAGWESYLTPKLPIGVWRGGGGRGSLRVIYDSQLQNYALCLYPSGLELKRITCIKALNAVNSKNERY